MRNMNLKPLLSNAAVILLMIIQSSWGNLSGQVSVGSSTVNSSAILEISSTSKGLLMPRLSNTQMLAISSPASGLQVINTDAGCVYFYNGSQWLSTLNSYKTFANAGVNVQFDNLVLTIPTSGNRSVQIKTVSGTISLSGMSNNYYLTASAGTTSPAVSSVASYNRQSSSFGTNYTYWDPNLNIQWHGSYQELFINDETNSRSYHIICMIGNGYNDNYFEIERVK